jgi:hypothetical protein
MSINPVQSAAPALPGLHLQGHGHKKGVHGATRSDAATVASDQGPAGSTQNLFGSLLNSVEELIGVKPAAAAATHTPPKA